MFRFTVVVVAIFIGPRNAPWHRTLKSPVFFSFYNFFSSLILFLCLLVIACNKCVRFFFLNFIRFAVDVPSTFFVGSPAFVGTNARCQCVSYVSFWIWILVFSVCVCFAFPSWVFAVRVAGCRSALWFRFFADCDFNSKRFNVFIVACAKSCHSFNSFGCCFLLMLLLLYVLGSLVALLYLLYLVVLSLVYLLFGSGFTCVSARRDNHLCTAMWSSGSQEQCVPPRIHVNAANRTI